MTAKHTKKKESAHPEEALVDIGPAVDVEAPASEAGAPTAPTPPAAAPSEVEVLKAQIADLTDRYLRTKADSENFRRRTQRDLADARDSAKAATVDEVLTVFDHFRMAMAHLEQASDIATLKQGMEMIFAEFNRALEALGINVVDATGQVFDPNLHQAIAQEPSATVPAGTVVRQWKCGYRLGDRLLRPATVVVSTGAPPTEPAVTIPTT